MPAGFQSQRHGLFTRVMRVIGSFRIIGIRGLLGGSDWGCGDSLGSSSQECTGFKILESLKPY